jgi:hypothetical protein
MLTDLVDRANMRVIQGGSGTSFPLEALSSTGFFKGFSRKNLECYLPLEIQVLSKINLSHSPSAQFFQNLEVGKSLADHEMLSLRTNNRKS